MGSMWHKREYQTADLGVILTFIYCSTSTLIRFSAVLLDSGDVSSTHVLISMSIMSWVAHGSFSGASRCRIAFDIYYYRTVYGGWRGGGGLIILSIECFLNWTCSPIFSIFFICVGAYVFLGIVVRRFWFWRRTLDDNA